MWNAPFVCLLALAQAPQAPAEVRSVNVSVTLPKGEAPTGLALEEVVVVENGVARDIVRIEKDTRPVDIAVLVDTSAAMGSSYRLNVVDAVIGFLKRLPGGSRFVLWTTGDRPTKQVELTGNVVEADKALKRVSPQGGNTVLDAIVEAQQALKKTEGNRQAMLVVSALGIEFSGRDRYQVVEKAKGGLSWFGAVLFQEDASGDPGVRLNYDYVLSELAKGAGGLYETPISALAVTGTLERLAADLAGQFRVSYATVPELSQRKIEVTVARPGAKVRVGPSSPARP